jgi:hypothetical protein
MTRKTTKSLRMAPVQELMVKPLEDLADQAALDERIQQAAATALSSGDANGDDGAVAAAIVVWCRQLSAETRWTVATELGALLSPEQRRELVERWTNQSSSAVKRRKAKSP